MRSYQIYLIEEEVAEYYYGREKMFFDLFSEYGMVSGSLREIIQKQIVYITKPLPVLHIHHLLKQAFAKRKDFTILEQNYRYKESSQNNGVELIVGDQSLQLNAWGNFDSESLFLEVLRKYDGRLLAIDFEHERYGWLKPIKDRKYV